MKKYLKLLLAAALVFSAIHGSAQTDDPHKLPSILPPSPNAAELGKYGSIPVNLSTGSANYTLPLMSMTSGALKLSVSLAYSGNGIKVDQIASRAGLGWILNAGGVINRTVYDDPDEMADTVKAPVDIESNTTDAFNFLDKAALNKDGFDTQPDIFSFNFNGYSGKFILDPNDKSKVIFLDKTNLKIAIDFTTTYGTMVITDPNGVKYYFGGDDATETSRSASAGSGCGGGYSTPIQTAWYLTKIEDLNGDKIEFSYEPIELSYETAISQTYMSPNPEFRGSLLYDPFGPDIPAPGDSQTTCVSSILNEGVYLDKITTSRGEQIQFSYTTRSDIDNEVLFSKLEHGFVGDTALKTLDFTYEQVHTTGGNSPSSSVENTYRPYLTQVKEYNKGLTDHKTFEFHYYHADGLPKRLSYAQDSFGYYNGKTGNSGFLPASPISGIFPYTPADRKSYSTYANYGMLSKVIYPTLGSDSIIYESHTTNENIPEHYTPTGHSVNLFGDGTGLRTEVSYTQDITLDADFKTRLIFDATYSGSGVNDLIHQGASLTITDLNTSIDVFYNFLKIDEIYNDSLLLHAGNYRVTLTGFGAAGRGHASFDYIYGTTLIPEQNNTIIVGGVRVARVITNDPFTGKDLIKSYNYNKYSDPSLSSGILLRPAVNYFSATTVKLENSIGDIAFPKYTLAASDGNISLYAESGNHILYPDIIESDGTGLSNGGVLHQFDIHKDVSSILLRGDKFPHMPFDVLGLPEVTERYQMVFRIGNDDGKIKLKEIFTHTKSIPVDSVVAYLGRKKYTVDFHYFLGTPYDLASYNIKSYWNYVDSSKVINYDIEGLNPVIELTENFYDNATHLQLTRTKTTGSDGRVVTKQRSYPQEMVDNSLDPTGVYAAMIAVNKIAPVIEEKELLPSSFLVSKRKTNYYEFFTNLFLPQTIDEYNTTTAGNETRIRFLKYDSKGNPLSMAMEDGMKVNYVWSFDSTLPVIQVNNVDYTTFESTIGTSNITDFSALTNPGKATIDTFAGTIKTSFPGAQVTSVSHILGVGVSSVTDVKGLTSYFEYDNFHRLSLVKNYNGDIVKSFRYNYAGNPHAYGFASTSSLDLVLDQPDMSGTFVAPHSIRLAPGFKTAAGQTFHAYINPALDQCASLTLSLSSSQNYVATFMPRIAGVTDTAAYSSSTCNLTADIQYIDGLGRPLQNVQWKASPGKKDLVQIVDYDAYGREEKKYLPYAEQTSANGSFKSAALTNQANFYSTGSGWDTRVSKTAQPFSIAVFDHSPLNKVLEQGAPGAVWQPYNVSISGSGHTAKADFNTNLTADTVKLWVVTSTGAQTTANYANNTLYKTVAKDENWASGKSGTTEEFKDKQGRVVLKKVWQSAANALKTWYVYDDFGNLKYVIPPGVNTNSTTSFVESSTIFKNFIYGYHYDGRNRLIEKKIPGRGWEFMVYNKLDQVVMTQDSAHRALAPQQWLVNKYDVYGRMVQTGLYVSKDSTAGQSKRIKMQNSLDTMLVAHLYEGRNTTGYGYTTLSFPVMTTMYTTTYYDNYSNIPGFTAVAAYNQSASYSSKTKGLPTVTRVNIFNSTRYQWTVNYYDDQGQVVRSVQEHYKAASTATTNYDDITSHYNFAHQIDTTIRRHYVLGVEKLYVKNVYTYDHQGRKIDSYQTTGSTSTTTANSPVLLARQEYNEVGQLKNKKLHSTDSGSTFAQDVAYNYNERGWVKSMGSALFDDTLRYTETISGVTPQFNGNISRQEWAGGAHYYNYTYDPLNRLKTAISDAGNNEDIGYDVMGNITRLTRRLNGLLIDQLKYTYTNGNQQSAVLDSNANTADPRFQLAGTTNYTYNGNGELRTRTNSANTGNNLASITYTYLGQLRTATVAGSTLTYTYDALGNKLRKTHSTIDNEYIRGIHYEGGTFAFAQTEVGRVLQNGSGADPAYRYEYILTDHLGNGRVYFDINSDTARTIQKEDYYAFGLALQSTLSGTENKYQYNGKEQQDEVRMYDYGARFYDPIIGRWNSIDPLAEQTRRFSPYNYTLNNPIRFIDPDGMAHAPATYDWVYDKDGNVRWDKTVTSEDDEDLKEGDTYIGKTGEYITKGGYTIQLYDLNKILKGDRGWDYEIPHLNKDPEGLTLQEAIAACLPLLNTGEGIAVGTAIVASGEIGGVEAAGNFLIGQLSRRTEFLGGLAENAALKTGTNIVYHGIDAAGKVRYVGITERAADLRFAEHLSSGTEKSLLQYRVIQGATGLTRAEARAWEQSLINEYGLMKNGGQLLNEINSIAPKNWAQFGL